MKTGMLIEDFIESEKTRVLRETEVYGRVIFTEFVDCMSNHKGGAWEISELSIADVFVYYSRVDAGPGSEHYARLAKRTVSRFIRYAMTKGVLKGKDWEDLENDFKSRGI
ncbi:MAG: hypothetical protein AB2L13_06175 [Spirochaetota bacterium]|jgi:hypothetical protein